MKNNYLIGLAALLIVLFFAISAYSFLTVKDGVSNEQIAEQKQQDTEQKIEQTNKLKKFKNSQDLADFLEKHSVLGDTNRYGGGINGGVMETLVMDSEMGLGAPNVKAVVGNDSSEEIGGSADYSNTNIQVEGVDEADIIKTDGEYIYLVAGNNLYIVSAVPADTAQILSKTKFDSRPENIYINGDNLIVFGRDSYNYLQRSMPEIVRGGDSSFFKVFDISDKESPVEIRDLSFEGNYTNSRMIGDYVYFVVSNYNYYYADAKPVLPLVVDGGQALPNECSGEETCLVPDVYYFDVPYDSYNFTTVAAVNVVDNGQEIDRDVYILSGNQNMYVSTDNIYITYTEYINEYELIMETTREMLLPRLSTEDQKRVSDIENVAEYILSQAEKNQKIARVIERYIASLGQSEQERIQTELEMKMKERYRQLVEELEKTIIHKIAINDGEPEYQTLGEVPGYVLNQFSMDESGDYFRIATTKGRSWSRFMDESDRGSYSNLFVLDKDLKIVGRVEKLARGEQIYSVRFMQDRAYLVTFQQVDPLFVIDLKEPNNPQVLGELKVPGFSNYLHPYNDNLLIGLGKDTKLENIAGREEDVVRTLGVKLSLFDVSDVSAPREVDTYVLGGAGSDSIALYDHKAFLFSRDKNLLVIPATIRKSTVDNTWGELSFSGAAIFNISEEGFELKGQIDHSNEGEAAKRNCLSGYCYYNNNVLRTLYINDFLYSMSNNYLKVNTLDNLNDVKTIELEKLNEPEILGDEPRHLEVSSGGASSMSPVEDLVAPEPEE